MEKHENKKAVGKAKGQQKKGGGRRKRQLEKNTKEGEQQSGEGTGDGGEVKMRLERRCSGGNAKSSTPKTSIEFRER